MNINKNYLLKIKNFISVEARQLIWSEFFESRKRGVALITHFPWIDDKKEKIACLTIEAKNKKESLVGVLVMLTRNFKDIGDVGFIGMVCVNANFRGLGLSSEMLECIKSYASQEKLSKLVLWTSQPKIYEKTGFVVDSEDIYANICNSSLNSVNKLYAKQDLLIKTEQYSEHGVPAFAEEVLRVANRKAILIVCKKKENTTLVKWTGDNSDVVSLASEILLSSWRIVAENGDLIIKELISRGFTINLMQGAKRMVLDLKSDIKLKLPYVNILFRI